jgi:hypothetical protein
MINVQTYRGFTIIVNVGSGGWIIQRLEKPYPASTPLWVQHASVPGSAEDTARAMEWIDRYFEKGGT